MFADRIETVVESFENDQIAQDAVRELRAVGFTATQIDLVSHNDWPSATFGHDFERQSEFPIAFEVIPGMLSAAASRTLSGPVPDATDDLFGTQLKSGNTIVSVKAGTRADIARSVLNRFRRGLQSAEA